MSFQSSPTFSFLIANYNNREYASELLDSLLSQTREDWEAIIIDDCSPDGGIADIVAQKNDPRFSYYQLDENRGAAHAWNLGFGKSQGKLFPITGADDIFQPTYLEEVYNVFMQFPNTSIVYVDLELFGSSTGLWVLDKKEAKDLAERQWLPHGGACITREVMFKSGGYYEGPELRHGNIDWDFWLSVAENAPFEVQHLNKALYRYRQHAKNMSKSRGLNEYKTHECLYARHKDFFDSYNQGSNLLARGYFESCATHWLAKDFQKAIKLAQKGIEYKSPAQPTLWNIDAPIPHLAKLVAALEKHFEGMGQEALAFSPDNLDTRVQLVAACVALQQFEKAEENVRKLFSSCFGQNEFVIASQAAVQLSLLFSKLNRLEESLEAAKLASICNPHNADAIYLCVQDSVHRKKYNEAMQYFVPWLQAPSKQNLVAMAPYMALFAERSGKSNAWLADRLAGLSQSAEKASTSEDFFDRIYDVPLGRRLVWEYRAKDLYERYGATSGGHEALSKAIHCTGAKTVLEIGCGNGRNLVLFSKLGLESVGQEISASAISFAEQRHLPNTTLICKPLPGIDFKGQTFDLVVCNRVLQHIKQDELETILDCIARLGRFVYINESLPDDDIQESWYLKKYDFLELMQSRDMRLVDTFSDKDVRKALLFGR